MAEPGEYQDLSWDSSKGVLDNISNIGSSIVNNLRIGRNKVKYGHAVATDEDKAMTQKANKIAPIGAGIISGIELAPIVAPYIAPYVSLAALTVGKALTPSTYIDPIAKAVGATTIPETMLGTTEAGSLANTALFGTMAVNGEMNFLDNPTLKNGAEAILGWMPFFNEAGMQIYRTTPYVTAWLKNLPKLPKQLYEDLKFDLKPLTDGWKRSDFKLNVNIDDLLKGNSIDPDAINSSFFKNGKFDTSNFSKLLNKDFRRVGEFVFNPERPKIELLLIDLAKKKGIDLEFNNINERFYDLFPYDPVNKVFNINPDKLSLELVTSLDHFGGKYIAGFSQPDKIVINLRPSNLDNTFSHEVNHALGTSGSEYEGFLGSYFMGPSEYAYSEPHLNLLDYNTAKGTEILKNDPIRIGHVAPYYEEEPFIDIKTNYNESEVPILGVSLKRPHIYNTEELFNDFNDIGISLGTKTFSPLNGYRTNNALMKFENDVPYEESHLGKYINMGIPNFEDTFKRAITGRIFRRDGGRLVKRSCKNDLK